MADLITYSVKNHVARITFNRFKFSHDVPATLKQDLNRISSQVNHEANIHVVILTGTGKFFFSDNKTGNENINNIANEVADINKPVIAAINGDAIGLGLEIALACDIRLAATSARFGLSQITNGKIPSSGGTQRLPRLVGRGKATELILLAGTQMPPGMSRSNYYFNYNNIR